MCCLHLIFSFGKMSHQLTCNNRKIPFWFLYDSNKPNQFNQIKRVHSAIQQHFFLFFSFWVLNWIEILAKAMLKIHMYWYSLYESVVGRFLDSFGYPYKPVAIVHLDLSSLRHAMVYAVVQWVVPDCHTLMMHRML